MLTFIWFALYDGRFEAEICVCGKKKQEGCNMSLCDS
jgi:hypothetical protein